MHRPPPQSEEDIVNQAIRDLDAAEKRAKILKESNERALIQKREETVIPEVMENNEMLENPDVKDLDHSKKEKKLSHDECVNVEMAPTAILRNNKPNVEPTNELITSIDTLNQPLLRFQDTNETAKDETTASNETQKVEKNFSDVVTKDSYCFEQISTQTALSAKNKSKLAAKNILVSKQLFLIKNP